MSIGSAMRAPFGNAMPAPFARESQNITWSPLHSKICTPGVSITTCKHFEHAIAPTVKACEAAARIIANSPRAKKQRAKIEHAKVLCMSYREQLALVTPEAISAHTQKPTLQQPPGIACHVSSNAPNSLMSYPRKKGTPIKS